MPKATHIFLDYTKYMRARRLEISQEFDGINCDGEIEPGN
jgi:hypothetical protein